MLYLECIHGETRLISFNTPRGCYTCSVYHGFGKARSSEWVNRGFFAVTVGGGCLGMCFWLQCVV